MIKTAILVGIGGFAGTVLRFWLSTMIKSYPFPATLFINLAGCFLIGLVLGFTWKSDEWKIFLGVGFCGGFTTFSAFAIENVSLLERGKLNIALWYIALSIAGGLLAAWLGFKLIQK